MAVNSILSGSPHVRPMWALSTCGEPDEIKKNTHPKYITALFRACRTELVSDKPIAAPPSPLRPRRVLSLDETGRARREGRGKGQGQGDGDGKSAAKDTTMEDVAAFLSLFSPAPKAGSRGSGGGGGGGGGAAAADKGKRPASADAGVPGRRDSRRDAARQAAARRANFRNGRTSSAAILERSTLCGSRERLHDGGDGAAAGADSGPRRPIGKSRSMDPGDWSPENDAPRLGLTPTRDGDEADEDLPTLPQAPTTPPYASRARQFDPDGGQFDFVWLSPHVRPMGVHRTCGEPDEIRRNTHPKNIAPLFREQAHGAY